MISYAGNFLIAMPGMRGSYFGDTLTYLVTHDEKGAFGLVVNRTLPITVAELLGELGIAADAVAADAVPLDGGPVEPQRGFILHTDDVRLDNSDDAGDRLLITHDRRILEAIGVGEGPRDYLMLVGYAGWGAGQLNAEIDSGSWITCPGSQEILFHTPVERRLSKVAHSIGIDMNLLSNEEGLA